MIRAAAYLRVSTKEQADRDLSIPDQRRQIAAFCKAKGWLLVAEYSDAGVSARSDRRPEFQRMVGDARQKPKPFDMVVVYAWSRFFRDAVQSGLYQRTLEKQGIGVASVSQDIANDHNGKLLRMIVAATDEHHSAVNAEHTLRGMKENVRQGFANGLPPYGFKAVDVERRGDKMKRRFEHEPTESETVKLIFRLYVHGDGKTGPLGVKGVVKYLNAKGYLQRSSKVFNSSFVNEVLRNAASIGTYVWNKKDSKTRLAKSEDEWITIAVPSIVDRQLFDTVQERLTRNNRRVTPPRLVNTPILLSGLIVCGCCGKAMTRGGSGKDPKYRYYHCSTRNRVGPTACKGLWLPMEKVNQTITEGIIERVLHADYLPALVREVQKTQAQGRNRNDNAKLALQRDLRRLRAEISNLYDAVAKGRVENDEYLTAEVNRRKGQTDDVVRRLALLERQATIPTQGVTNRKIVAFGQALAEMLRTGDIKFRQALLRTFVDRIEVDRDEIRISGSKNVLAAALADADKIKSGEVRAFAQEWRPRRDLNARPPD